MLMAMVNDGVVRILTDTAEHRHRCANFSIR